MSRRSLAAVLAVLVVAFLACVIVHPLDATVRQPENQPGPTDPSGAGSCSQSDCSAVNCNCGVYPGYDFTGWCACSSIACNRYCHFDKTPT